MNNKHPEVERILRATNHYEALGVSRNASK